MAAENFFNIDDPTQGIATRVFSGQQAMLSLVRREANNAGGIHAHPEEQWGMSGRGIQVSAFEIFMRMAARRAPSGPDRSTTA